ncbi:MAG: LamG-like jellyroll fold domain-containing protein [Planctomycetota bacterium]|nr:LamG-like jellyroll fold domain-containing protein [Planctomycetota bacterium]
MTRLIRLVTALLPCVLVLVATTHQTDAALVGQWNIDEGSGGVVAAQTGSINGSFLPGGTVNWEAGGPPTTTLPGGGTVTPSNHLNFDLDEFGDSFDYVEMLDSGGTLSPTAVTVAFWAKALDTGFDNSGKVILSKWSDTDDFSWEFGFNISGDNSLFWRVQPDSGGQQFVGSQVGFTASDFNDGLWHHFVGTYDGAAAEEATLIVDGIARGTVPVSGDLRSGSAPMLLGQRPYSDPWKAPFKGRLGGSLLVFDNALTGEEAADLGGFEYVPLPPPPPPEVTGRWDLNEVVAGAPSTTPKVLGSQDGVINGNVTLQAGGPPTTVLPDDTEITNSNHFVFGGLLGDNINLGSGAELSPGEITVAFWAKATGGEEAADIFLSKHSPSGSSYEFAIGNNGNIFFRAFAAGGGQALPGNNAADPFTMAEFGDGNWHHFVGTHDGSLSSLYVDGEFIESLALSGQINDTTGVTDLLVGERPYTPYEGPFDGLIGGSILVFDGALTAEEVAALIGGPIPGDANKDGIVDVSDLGILATNYGAASGKSWGEGDFTGDGAVDVSDLGILATNYGATSSAAAVPEPGTLILLAFGTLVLLITRRKSVR